MDVSLRNPLIALRGIKWSTRAYACGKIIYSFVVICRQRYCTFSRVLLHYCELQFRYSENYPDCRTRSEHKPNAVSPSFRDYAKCTSVSLIYTKSRGYTATNKGYGTTRRMLDVARNVRVTFTSALGSDSGSSRRVSILNIAMTGTGVIAGAGGCLFIAEHKGQRHASDRIGSGS